MTEFETKICFKDNFATTRKVVGNELQSFCKKLSEKAVYWNDNFTEGFWTDIDNIRYIEFIKIVSEDEENGSISQSTNESDTEIPCCAESTYTVEDDAS